MLSAGRWAAEKRIHLLIEALPKDCALVIVGDGTSEYADKLAAIGSISGQQNVLSLRRMLNASELPVSYAASDLFLSASNFETLGNTVIESLCSGTPCALQPAQGHLEFVKDGVNSWFVNFDDTEEAKSALSRIVALGLDSKSLQVNIPEFASMGKSFRSADFPQDFKSAVMDPALACGRQQWSGGLPKKLLEVAKRTCAMLSFILLWLLLRIFTRIGFVFLRDPEFEVLGPLGGAVDDKKAPTVLTYPCLRPFFGTSSCRSSDASEKSPDADGTDYASHYESARKPWWNRRL